MNEQVQAEATETISEDTTTEVIEEVTTDDTAEDGTTDEATETDTTPLGKARKEAAAYRTKLRAAETELDQTKTQLDQAQRQIVATYMREMGGINPEAIWAAGHTPTDLLDDDGSINTEKLDATITEVRQKFGLTRRNRIPEVPMSGANLGRARETPGWKDLIRG